MRMTSGEATLNLQLLEAVRLSSVEHLKTVIQEYRSRPYGSCLLEFDRALCLAAQKGHTEVVRLLLRTKAGVAFVDKEGKRALHYAAEIGSADIVKQILNAGSPVNVADSTGATALHYAADYGHIDTVLMLLQEGAHVNRARLYQTGETPLHLACKSGNVDVVKMLLARGAVIHVTTSMKGFTPLHCASKGRHLEVMRLLCQLGADTNRADTQGESPLVWAAANGALDVAEVLMDFSCDLSVVDNDLCTPLHHTAGHTKPTMEHIEIAKLLIEHGCDLDAQDRDGCTPLHHCAIAGNLPVATLLLNAGAAVDPIEQTRNESPLNTATRLPSQNSAAMVELLVSAGADVNTTDKGRTTPLHNLQGWKGGNRINTMALLLQHGSRLNATTTRGYTVLDRCVVHYVMGDRSNIDGLCPLVAAGTHLKPMARGGRPLHQSPLCWLTWHGCLKAARFLVNCGWDLRNEYWIRLPGKTEAAEQFLTWLRETSLKTKPLWCLCRKTIREELILTNDDRDITSGVHQLPLPGFLKRQLLFESEIVELQTEDES